MILNISKFKLLKCIIPTVLILSSFFSTAQVVKFSGKILNHNSEKIRIINNNYSKIIKVDQDGTFSDTLKLIAGEYSLSDYNESTVVYLEPGYDLFLSLNTKEFDESIKYKGVGEQPNNFLAQYYLFKEENSKSYSKVKLMTDDEYFNYLIQNHKAISTILENYNISNDKFNSLQKDKIHFNMLNNILKKSGDAYFNSKSSASINDFMNNAIKIINFKDSAFYNTNKFYNSFFNNYLSLGIIANNSSCLEIYRNEINNNQKQKIIKSIASGISFYNDKDIAPYYEALKLLINDKDKLRPYKAIFDKIISLEKGNTSPSFKYENIQGQLVSLEDLKGQLVYIDVWATWCGPCKAQIPYLKELEERYRGKDISFVSISIDQPRDKEKWRKMVVDKELKGIQLIADKAWKSSFAKDYVIKGIPRFILIDKKGKIISPFAPQPGSYGEKGEMSLNTAINDMINKYLN